MKQKIVKIAILLATVFLIAPEISNAESPKKHTLEEKQAAFLDWKFGMFIHFGMGTFANREWATGHEDPGLFNPGQLDIDQWIKEAKSAGMKYAVLTVKHTGGWCLWPSEHTQTHDMTAFRNYKNGKGDIVREFVDACRNHGIKIGFYYCLPGDYSTRHGNLEDAARGYKITDQQQDLHGLPPEAKGDFAGFIEKQITELSTRYGEIDVFWFDQYNNGYTKKHWPEFKNLVHKLQPNCVVIGNNALDYKVTDIHSYEYPIHIKNRSGRALPPENNENPSEVCDAIASGMSWFWNNERKQELQSAKDIVERLEICNRRNSNYLLNVQPDRDGLISGKYLERLREIGLLIKDKGLFEN
jgi:alpha-L-fucosidase